MKRLIHNEWNHLECIMYLDCFIHCAVFSAYCILQIFMTTLTTFIWFIYILVGSKWHCVACYSAVFVIFGNVIVCLFQVAKKRTLNNWGSNHCSTSFPTLFPLTCHYIWLSLACFLNAPCPILVAASSNVSPCCHWWGEGTDQCHIWPQTPYLAWCLSNWPRSTDLWLWLFQLLFWPILCLQGSFYG